MIDANAFLEWADVFGHLYGTAAADTEREQAAGRDVVLVIDVQGARELGRRGVAATRIFVLPPSRDALEARLRERSVGHEDEAVLRRRLETARGEVAASGDYDYVVVNDVMDDCVERLRSIVLAERARAEVMREIASDIAATFRA
jgi:guanylate kinase